MESRECTQCVWTPTREWHSLGIRNVALRCANITIDHFALFLVHSAVIKIQRQKQEKVRVTNKLEPNGDSDGDGKNTSYTQGG